MNGWSEGKEHSKERLGWLDFGKACGILVVLAVHAGCSLGALTFYGGMFYMPVFFVAAGYTFRRKEGEPYGRFLRKKAERLLIPYAAASAFLWLFFWAKDSLLAGNPGDVKPLSLFGILYSRNQMWAVGYAGENPVLMNVLNAPLWFLTAMFLVYAWYGLISRSKWKWGLLGAGLACSIVWHYASPLLLPWSLEAVPYFACFFAAGERLRGRGGVRALLDDPRLTAGCAAGFLLLGYLCGSVNLSCGDYGRSMLAYLFVGSAGSFLVFAAGAWLEKISPAASRAVGLVGQETLLILCLHMFLFMFLRTGAVLLGFGEGLTQAVLVFGSLAALTAAGRVRRRR
ncbi:MAG: acyltransferase family protein [Eubacteriales bacterium]|nr:acyltransferase family protein [Eubacteriales bacterium]